MLCFVWIAGVRWIWTSLCQGGVPSSCIPCSLSFYYCDYMLKCVEVSPLQDLAYVIYIFPLYFLDFVIYLCVCVHTHAHIYHDTYMVRKQHVEIGSLLLPSGSELRSTGLATPLPTEPSYLFSLPQMQDTGLSTTISYPYQAGITKKFTSISVFLSLTLPTK